MAVTENAPAAVSHLQYVAIVNVLVWTGLVGYLAALRKRIRRLERKMERTLEG